MKHLRVWPLVGVSIIILLILLSISILLQRNFPDPTGPYGVARTSQNWVDAARPEVLTSDPNDFRNVPVTYWYPTQPGNLSKAPYFPNIDRLANALAASGEVDSLQAFGLRFITTHEVLDGSLNPQSNAYPVVIFSPGNGTNIEFYAGIAEELASYGYVVIGINHPFDVAAVTIQDGSIALFKPAPIEMQASEVWIAERVAVRLADVRFVLQELKTINASNTGLFAGHLDLNNVAVIGHSLGGITAAETCKADSTIRACANLDGIQRGGPFSAKADPAPASQPFMMITKEPQIPPKTIELFRSISSGSFRVVIRAANHDSFTDGPILNPTLLPVPDQADQILGLIRKYTLAFLDQTLKQRSSPLLAKSSQDSTVSVEIYSSN